VSANSAQTRITHPEVATSQQMADLIARLYPICRSITGDGLRDTLRIIHEQIPLQLTEVPTGTPVFDWTIPKEWNVRDAYIKDAAGRRVVDFRQCNLHVVNYSVPVHRRMALEELRGHLHALAAHPDWIPYRTTYYKEDWGFCLTQRQLDSLRDGEYEVCIDSSLAPGSLTLGEYCVAGDSSEEILVSCHCCHPSLCNDNLSGIAVAVMLAKHVAAQPHRRYSYRFLFIPGTIGAITWLSLHQQDAPRVVHGLVLAGVGDAGELSYKRSRRGDAVIDRAMAHVLLHSQKNHRLLDFSPYGYDERQFCSPGFNLPVGRLSRSIHGQFPEYHTSADNLSFVKPASLDSSLAVCIDLFSLLEEDRVYRNLNPYCEPQLGRRGLYSAMGGQADSGKRELAMLWTLNLSDGKHSLLEIAERSGLPFAVIQSAAELLRQHGLIQQELPSSLGSHEERHES
jgi:aminopeptidase-like protein